MVSKEPLSIDEILNQPASEIERPPPIPAGTYAALVRGLPEYGESQKKKTPYARFTLQLIDNGQSDEDEVERDRWYGKTLRKDLWLTSDSMWRTVEFIKHCGLDIEPGVTVQQYLESCNGCQIQVTVSHRTQRGDDDGIFAEVKSTAPLPLA